MKVWIDGRIADGADASVPVTDHGFLYGDGVFESFRVEHGRIFRLAEHLARLETSARAIALELPKTRGEIAEAVLRTVRALGRQEAYVRLVVSRGDGPLGINPLQCTRPRIVCIAGEIRMFPDDKLARGLDLLTATVRRPAGDALDPRVKSLNYLNNVLATGEARMRGGDDALVLNAQGAVVEASAANVFVVAGRRCATPPASDGALEGIVRGAVLELARDLGLDAQERRLGRVDFFAADEAFLTGTGAGIVAVRSLDGRPIGEGRRGPVTERIVAAFAALVAREGTAVWPDARDHDARVA
jgi:branched-chain amino acid aminotransferase